MKAPILVVPAGPSKRTEAGVLVKPMPCSVTDKSVGDAESRAVRIGVLNEIQGVTLSCRGILVRPASSTLTSTCGPASRLEGKATVSDSLGTGVLARIDTTCPPTMTTES